MQWFVAPLCQGSCLAAVFRTFCPCLLRAWKRTRFEISKRSARFGDGWGFGAPWLGLLFGEQKKRPARCVQAEQLRRQVWAMAVVGAGIDLALDMYPTGAGADQKTLEHCRYGFVEGQQLLAMGLEFLCRTAQVVNNGHIVIIDGVFGPHTKKACALLTFGKDCDLAIRRLAASALNKSLQSCGCTCYYSIALERATPALTRLNLFLCARQYVLF